MPLVALDQNGQRIVSCFYMGDVDGWESLREQVRSGEIELSMTCCGHQGWLRTSPNGLMHFYHRRKPDDDSCRFANESIEHLYLKAKLVEQLRRLGWDAQPEVSGNGWRADVLASKGDRRVVFEVQLSSQSASETQRRQRNYRRDGLQCIWLMKKVPKDLESSIDLPAFQVKEDDAKEWQVDLGNRTSKLLVGVNEFLEMIDGDRIHHRALQSHHVTTEVYQWNNVCWACKRDTPVIFADGWIECNCNSQLRKTNQANDVVGAAVSQALETGQIVSPVPFRFTHSRELARPAWRPHCMSCNAPQGNFHLEKELCKTRAKLLGNVVLPVDAEDPVLNMGWWATSPEVHWCILSQKAEAVHTAEPEPEQLTLEGFV